MNNVFLASIINHTYEFDVDSEEPSNCMSSSEKETAKKKEPMVCIRHLCSYVHS